MMSNRWKIQPDPLAGSPFVPGRTPLRQKTRGSLNWANPYEQFRPGHWEAMYQGDLLDRLLEVQHLLSPMRAPLSHEPEQRQSAGPPAIDNYGKLRLIDDVNVPADWRIREMVPRWGDREPERPRPGGAPSGLYDFPVVG